jgi:putative ABC transport system permease protein
MFKNYSIVALRNLLRHKLYSFINIVGLAVGMAAVVLILLFVGDEIGYDEWLPDSDRIYRMHSTFNIPDRPVFSTVRSAGGLGWDMPAALPEVEAFTRLMPIGTVVIQGENAFSQTLTFVDEEFLDVFDLPFAQGNASSAFPDQNSVIISQEMAQKYFGDGPAVGQTLSFCCMAGDRVSLVVTAVFKDIPDNSHLNIDMAARIVREWFSAQQNMLESPTSVNVYSYYKFYEGTDTARTDEKIQAFIDELVPITPGSLGPDVTIASDIYDISLMNIRDIHLNAREQAADIGDMEPLGDIKTIYAFSIVALMILAIASINFINLSTARASQRAREVSLRKVVGAGRSQLIVQFLGESVIMTMLAALLAIALVELSLPLYNQVLSKDLAVDLTQSPAIFGQLFGASILLGLVSGIYPALILSGFRPARILKSNQSSGSEGSSRFRTALVILQFAISIGLVTVTAIVYAQSMFAKTVDLGFERENKVIIRGMNRSDVAASQDALINEFKNISGVSEAVYSSEVPTDNRENNTQFSVVGGENQGTLLTYISVDDEFFDAYEVEPLYGRTFSPDFAIDEIRVPDDENAAIISTTILNVSAAARLGYANPEDALGQVLATNMRGRDAELTVIGIVPDINFRSVRYGLQPTLYYNNPSFVSSLTLNIEGTSVADILPQLEQVWARHVSQQPFNYQILDEMIESQYAAEDAQATMFGVFAILAILIASLGLFGLSAFSVERRTKEIGIRKVLGAGVGDIIQLLVWQFSKPVLWANFLALPVAAWFMADWLQGFEYRISEIYIALFGLVAALTALLIAWATVGGHAVRVARTNPVHALRYE